MQEALGLIQTSVNFSSITIAAPRGEPRGSPLHFVGRRRSLEVPRRNVAGVSWAAMRLLTVSRAQFAENNLVHKADQMRDCHVEEFMCGRSASKTWWSGDDERIVYLTEVMVAQDTWHYHQATVAQGRRLAEAFFREAWH